MTAVQDFHPEKRKDVLEIFNITKNADAGADFYALYDAFNKAAAAVEQTPGIVEYTNPDRQSNKVRGLTDGTDFRHALHDIATTAHYYPLRARAVKALGNISTRHYDYITTFYDLEKLAPLIATAPNEEVAGAGLAAFRQIATDPNRKHASAATVSHFQIYGSQRAHGGGAIVFKSAEPGHRTLNSGGTYMYDYADPITYLEAAVGLAAHVLKNNPLPKARLYAAENLREIALSHKDDKLIRFQHDYQSLVAGFVKEILPQEKDPAVLAVLDKILNADPQQAEKQRVAKAAAIARTLSAP